MRFVTSFAAVVILCGCRSTQVVNADWNDPAINQRLQAIGQSGSGRVVLVPPEVGQEGAFTALPLVLEGPFALRESGLELLNPRRQVERRQVAEIRYTVTKRRGQGFLMGALIGTAVGAGIGVAAVASGDDCPDDPDVLCEVAEIYIGPAAVMATGFFGALTGGLIGVLIGAPKIEVYRFRPDTAQQLSVVIGVGTGITANRGAR